ncbi:sigma-70 family RNA polymerase sigma factor [Nocardia colli]|uniref:Sigma-70 family RNA polymerase sigma factor n=1 Tax=Nocardia colli TaxID=2545717 RepID=A0A5N0DKP1_9NOCA|nr:sigma-70 family RNA polymerase sigma factor [Nocardia colli]KAA8877313.1 sigma-70 family RNA polymerase sigma factor [Nocardia colli]
MGPDATEPVEKLFRQHSAAVYRYGYKAFRGDAGQAEDLVQQVFLAVVEQYRRDFRGRSEQHILQLIMKIAVRRVIDARRRQTTSAGVGFTALDDAVLSAPAPPGAVGTDPAEQVVSLDTVRRFWFAISRELTDTEYQVALLAWELQWPDEEIAETLQVTVSTVYSHKSRARRKIRESTDKAETRILFPLEEDLAADGSRVGAKVEGEVQA